MKVSLEDSIAQTETQADNNTFLTAPPKIRALDDVLKTSNLSYADYLKEVKVGTLQPIKAPDYESGMLTQLSGGIDEGMRQLMYTPEQLQIFGGQAQMALGNIFGKEEYIERGRSNVQTANRELSAKIANLTKDQMMLSKKDQQTLMFGVGSALPAYGVMFAAGGLSGAAAKSLGAGKTGVEVAQTIGGLGTMTAQQIGQEAQEDIQLYQKRTGDVDIAKMTGVDATKDVATNLASATINGIIEKKFGFGEQLKMFKSPLSFGKGAVKTALSEGATEGIQSLVSSGIDLADGSINWQEFKDVKLRQAFFEAAVGGVLGGTVGVGVSMAQRSSAIKQLDEKLMNVIPNATDRQAIAKAVVDDGINTISDVISKEIELSSELKNKHGLVWDNMNKSVNSAIDESLKQGNTFFSDKSEEERAEYIMSTSKLFADQVLAEATKRNVNVSDVLDGAKIEYADGKIYLRGKDFGAKPQEFNLKSDGYKPPKKRQDLLEFLIEKGGLVDTAGELKAMDASKVKRGLVKQEGKGGMGLDKAREMAAEAGYIPKDGDISGLLDAISENLQGRKVFIAEDEMSAKESKAQQALNVDKAKDYLFQKGIDTKYMAENEIVERASKEYEEELKTTGQNINKVFSDIADTLSIESPIGEDTDNVFWQGEDLTKTPEFKNWFGDSKVVDNNGEPLVVYHGSVQSFESFDRNKVSVEGDMGAGFYFTTSEDDVSKNYEGGGPDFENKISKRASEIENDESISYDEAEEKARNELFKESVKYEVYLKMEKPVIIDGKNSTILLGDFENLYNREDFESDEDFDNEVRMAEDDYIAEFGYKLDNAIGQYVSDEDTVQEVKSEIFTIFADNGRITAQDLDKIFRENENLSSLEDYEGNIISLEVKRNIFEELGFDGVIDKTVSEKFKSMNIEADTSHYIVFNPNQIKSVENKGTFSTESDNIYMQNKKGEFSINDATIEITESSDYSTLPHEFSHFWLDNNFKYIQAGMASEDYKANFKGVGDWLGITESQLKTGFLQRWQHEKFATGYEKYLLTGELPSPILKSSFDNYDRWLKKVYKKTKSLKDRVKKAKATGDNIRFRDKSGKLITPEFTEDAIKFFKTMTSGGLDFNGVEIASKPEPELEKRYLEEQKRAEVFVKDLVEAPNVVSETTTRPTNITEGKKGISSVFERNKAKVEAALGEEIDSLEYNMTVNKEQAERAIKYVNENIKDAKDVVYGKKTAPDNILKTAIDIAYMQKMQDIGNNAEYVKALKRHSAEATLRGQEMSAERIATKTPDKTEFWADKLMFNKRGVVAQAIAKKIGLDSKSSPAEQLNKVIKNEALSLADDMIKATTIEEQQKILEKFSKELKSKYGLEALDKLSQSVDEEINAKNAKAWALNKVEEMFKVSVSESEIAEIDKKINDLEKILESVEDETGNPPVEALRIYDQLNKLIESKTPSSVVAILTNTVGRAMMLASVKSPILNIVSNAENLVISGLSERIANNSYEKAVNLDMVKKYLKYSSDAYLASGYNMSTAENRNFTNIYAGEKVMTTQGEGKFRKLAQKLETGIFKYSMGLPDSISKDLAFVDKVSLEATKQAKAEGAKDIEKRATEIFNDAILVDPKTDLGAEIRLKGIEYAHETTFTDNSNIAQTALQIREALNKVSGDLRLGDNLMPFVKTPANIVSLGLQYSIGLAYTIPKISQIIQEAKSGEGFSKTSQIAIKAGVRNGLGLIIAAMLAYAFDPKDYVPSYESLSPSEREIYKQKGAVFNSLRVGDKYISLDYLGVLGMPVAAYLNAQRGSKQNALLNYGTGSLSQFAKVPGLDLVSSLFKTISEMPIKSQEALGKEALKGTVDFIKARTIPSIVNDLAQAIDDYERNAYGSVIDSIKSNIPIVREELPKKFSNITGQAVKSEPAIQRMLFGGRVGTSENNALSKEVQDLKTEGENVSLTDITRYGDFKNLDEADKNKIREEFAKNFAEKSQKVIDSASFRRANAEKKADKLQAVRRKVSKALKREYREKIKQVKQ